jgi:RNA polymerase sigma-70 factor (ECF subfamily)
MLGYNSSRGFFMPEPGNVTRLLQEIDTGDKAAVDRLLPLLYDELHRLARAQFRRERGDHTLQPTALLHEAYLRMVDQRAPLESRGHFLALAATQMRRILLDYAKRHSAGRRGGGAQRVLLEDTVAVCGPRPVDMIVLDAAIEKLGALDPEQARLVELRFFGGLSTEQTAEAMGVSVSTLKRSWNSARAFLRREVQGGSLDARAVGENPADL